MQIRLACNNASGWQGFGHQSCHGGSIVARHNPKPATSEALGRHCRNNSKVAYSIMSTQFLPQTEHQISIRRASPDHSQAESTTDRSHGNTHLPHIIASKKPLYTNTKRSGRMAISAEEYVASLLKNERSIILILFILGAIVTVAIGLMFCVYRCCSRPEYVHGMDIEKAGAGAVADRATQSSRPPSYSSHLTPETQQLPATSSLPRLVKQDTCECRFIYGRCHTEVANTVSNQAEGQTGRVGGDLAHPHRRALRQGAIGPQLAYLSWQDDPPSYAELMAFSRG